MRLIRVLYQTMWRAGDCVSVPVREKYSFFHFPESVEIRIDGKTYITKPNAVIISRPDEPRWFCFRKDTYFNFFHVSVKFAQLLEKYHIPTGEILYPANPDFLNPAFRKMRMEFLSKEQDSQDMLELYLRELLIRLSREINRKDRTGVDEKLQTKLCNLRLEILSQPEKKWAVEELAQRVSLSPSRFHVVYRALFGISPVKDLIFARIDRAKLLLLEDDSITQAAIAEKLGYKNPYDFCRQFTKVTGMSPGSYRKKN